jgi:hypothetical protein
LFFGAIVAVFSAQSGSVLPTYAFLAAALLFVSTWLTVVLSNQEDPIQQSITIVCAGSPSKVRLAKLLVAFLLAAALGLLGLIGPMLASSGGLSLRVVLAGISAQLIAALAGVALGAVCSRPIVRRRAWAVLIGVAVGLATVIIPHAPPTRQLLVLFNRTGTFSLGLPILLIAAETVVIAMVLVSWSLRMAQRRS